VAEAKDMGLKLELPDVNESGARFVPTSDCNGIRYGLGGIKGVGELAAEAIVKERDENGPYKGFLDFCTRLAGTPAVNKRVLENLTRAGAFSSFDANRAKFFSNIEYVIKKMQQRAREKSSSQLDFFGAISAGAEEASDSELSKVPAFAPAEDLRNERELLGVYVSGSPLDSVSRCVNSIATFRLHQFNDQSQIDEILSADSIKVDEWKASRNPNVKDKTALKHLDVRIVAMLTSCSVKMTKPQPKKAPAKWAILEIDDDTKNTSVMCFAKTWAKYSAVENKVGSLILLSGEVSRRIDYGEEDKVLKANPIVGDYSFTVKEVYPFEEALEKLKLTLSISLENEDKALMEKVEEIKRMAVESPGNIPMRIKLSYGNSQVVDIDLGDGFKINPTMEFLSKLGKITSQKALQFILANDKIYLDESRQRWQSN
jgi:DNA polymerase III alpha subunit